MSNYQNITISVTDDHTLFRKGLISLIQTLGSNYEVVFEAANGNDFIDKLQQCKQVPQLAIMDINMPGKNGFETVAWLNKNYPSIKVLVVSMVNKEETIVRMLKMGVKGYLSKDVEPEILQIAIDSILQKGFYYTDFITGRLLHGLQKDTTPKQPLDELTEKEKEVLMMFCTEMTYKEMAAKLGVSDRTVEKHKEAICNKLSISSRIGLAIYAIKHKLVEL
ncbi:MAG: response regulator transcription factor [Deinococcales bacterium]|nr:response regulator transcription factor [Chitinophagaceae bacterium]